MRKFVTLLGLSQAAALLTIVFSVATSVRIPHWSIELFSHFRLQYLVVSLVLLILFTVLRVRVWAAALFATAVLNAAFVLPWYLPGAAGNEIDPGKSPLKLVHINVHSSNDDYERLIQFVIDEDPDIVVLQEITHEWVAGLDPLTERYPFSYAEPRNGNFGIAAYAKMPLASVTHVDSPPFNYPTIVATLVRGGNEFTLISTHPTIPVTGELFSARNEHLASIAQLVNSTTNDVILLGDFNASLWCPQLRKLQASTGLVNVRKGRGILPSWPTFFPPATIPIDHALVSNGIEVRDVHTGARVGSDHLPLVVTVAL